MNSKILTLSANNYRSVALRKDGVPVLVDYWATWCGPCRAMAPTLESLAEEFQGKVVIGKVDVDRERALATAVHIHSIPTMVLLKDGEVVDMFVGVTPHGTLRSKILAAMGSTTTQTVGAAALA